MVSCTNPSNLFTATIFSLLGYFTCPERIPTETATPREQHVSTYTRYYRSIQVCESMQGLVLITHSLSNPLNIYSIWLSRGFGLACSLAFHTVLAFSLHLITHCLSNPLNIYSIWLCHGDLDWLAVLHFILFWHFLYTTHATMSKKWWEIAWLFLNLWYSVWLFLV